MNRKSILTAAITHTCDDRETAYGPPSKNLSDCAKLWEAYLTSKYPVTFTITPEDVAWLNVLQKIARTLNGPPKPDTYEDAAAYAAIAGECSGPPDGLEDPYPNINNIPSCPSCGGIFQRSIYVHAKDCPNFGGHGSLFRTGEAP